MRTKHAALFFARAKIQIFNSKHITMKYFVLIFLFLVPFYTKGQMLVERFDGPEVTSSNNWTGDLADFIISDDHWLELVGDPEKKSSRIAIPITYSKNMEWKFDVKLSFTDGNSSNSNHIRFELLSDELSIVRLKQTYYVQIGSNNETISLRRLRETEDNASTLISEQFDPLKRESVALSIRVILKDGKDWSLYAKEKDEDEYILMGTCEREVEGELDFIESAIDCRYSKVKRGHFVDNVEIFGDASQDDPVKPEKPDYSPVSLESIDFPDHSSVLLSFSDPVDCSFASVSLSEIGMASDIDDSDEQNILVSFDGEMAAEHEYTLYIEGFADEDGLEIPAEELTFVLEKEVPEEDVDDEDDEDEDAPDSLPAGSVYISEIMADPKGASRMPDTEYIELHNTLSRAVSLDGWILVYRESVSVPLDGARIPAESYLIIYRTGDDMLSDLEDRAFASEKFPANLANSGNRVQLLDASGASVDDVTYDKAKSGISWERTAEGWSLSSDPQGGTPGAPNSSPLPDDEKEEDEEEEDNEDEEQPQPAVPNVEPRAIVINELLPDPARGGSEYIELYNRSDEPLPLRGLAIATRKQTGELAKNYPLSSLTGSLEAGAYLALTKDREGVLGFYSVADEDCVAELQLPILNNDGATLVLFNASDSSVVDEVPYSPDWHSPLLDDEKGVSLERIDPDADSDDAANWTSAAAASDFGTPGAENSQYLRVDDAPLTGLEKPTYSPVDGTYRFPYHLARAGFEGNIRIFDLAGREVALVARQELLATSGELVWDGKGSDGTTLPAGLYVVFAEFIHPEGEVYREKGVVLVRN